MVFGVFFASCFLFLFHSRRCINIVDSSLTTTTTTHTLVCVCFCLFIHICLSREFWYCTLHITTSRAVYTRLWFALWICILYKVYIFLFYIYINRKKVCVSLWDQCMALSSKSNNNNASNWKSCVCAMRTTTRSTCFPSILLCIERLLWYYFASI